MKRLLAKSDVLKKEKKSKQEDKKTAPGFYTVFIETDKDFQKATKLPKGELG